MSEKITAELGTFLQKSPTAFHAVENMAEMLQAAGFTPLTESYAWDICPGGKYYCTRNRSSIIAFEIGKCRDSYAFRITASHSDSPTFKLKEKSVLGVKEHYARLNTEGYGGMICSTWMDRPLSIAGRVLVKDGDKIMTKLLCFDRDLVLIPSLAIHMDRTVNDGHTFNKQEDMLPLIGDGSFKDEDLNRLIAEELNVPEDAILSSDLYLYSRIAPSIWGAGREYFSAARLDDLQCAFASLKGFLSADPQSGVNVFACFDNEEVGSSTKQGAFGTFLYDILKRINSALKKSDEDYCRALSQSFMISCDNAHAVHPNFPEKTDVNNCTYLNEGIVIKSHAGQKYTSDGVSIAIFKQICEKAGAKVQYFSNRSDKTGGSTLGNLAMNQVSLNAVDVGLPQLAMHSCYETAGIKDTLYLIDACRVFYNSSLSHDNDGNFTLTFNY